MANGDPAPDLTEAVITLQTTIQKFMGDARQGKLDLVAKENQPIHEGETVNILRLTPADEETVAQLRSLDEQLKILERQLRSRGGWHPPTRSMKIPSTEVLDMSDLSQAVALLRNLIYSTDPAQHTTPQRSLSAYSWVWDPVWHEFYTYITSQRMYIYLSRWRLNEARNVWEHVSVAGNNILPNVAAEMFGAWEDWTWDPVLGWYLDSKEEGTDEKIQVFASPWQVQEDGEWVYVGMLGQVIQ
ncbi:hypothetical protein GMOD_00003224 [Pyrenophora seminiperda CCB06]|uniref:Uncharacterized protein n=1 Tax=Pyrenophora seminiperda CCB06 TaxID=1302712 RepID=A0A3M7MIF1_9PLEO|nr:hypothetical protein GMOD_00003224 [Pyrenophora seminiperda CCB06]